MIQILFFAQLQEEIGSSIFFHCTHCTVQDVKEFVLESFPNINLDSVMIAVNEKFADAEDIVKAGDVVAFLPPVSGG